MQTPAVNGNPINPKSQTGGLNANWAMRIKGTQIAPATKITKTAGPSPESWPLKSAPHAGQLGFIVSKPSNKGALAHAGQRLSRPDFQKLLAIAFVPKTKTGEKHSPSPATYNAFALFI
jgi:hypothetical protein